MPAARCVRRSTTVLRARASSGSAMSGCRSRWPSRAPGFAVTGFDIDPAKTDALLDAARSYIGAVTGGGARRRREIGPVPRDRRLRRSSAAATSSSSACRRRSPAIASPTSPSSRHDRAGDRRSICAPGQLVVLESTTYPGTTRGDRAADPRSERARERARLLPRLLARARGSRQCAVSAPRRSRRSSAATAPKRARSSRRFYGARGRSASCRCRRRTSAEAVKITENIFRAVNIALVNELKVIFDAMGIDVWEVIEAAKTKPFGYMPFYPGPGPRRPLHPDRSVLPDLEGARVRHADALHRARRRDQRRACRAMSSSKLEEALDARLGQSP